MAKINRNDPCPCGSRKMYKSCCGLSNVIQMNPQLYNEELSRLKDTLLDFSLTNYGHQLIEQHELHIEPLLESDEKATEVYLTGLTIWMILSVPITNNHQTIFDIFYKQQKRKIKRTRTRNTFLEWKHASPSVYEIITADDDNKMITILDLLTNKTYKILIVDELTFLTSDILIGTIVPFVGYHCFLADMLEVPKQHKEMILYHIGKFSQEAGEFQAKFPEFLTEILIAKQPMLKWEKYSYKEVVHLLLTHLIEQNIDDEAISMGIIIWHKYAHFKQPTIKKPSAYAAALEYIILTIILNNTHVTQRNIAQEYDTTAGTVSTIYRKIMDSVEEYMSGEEDYDQQTTEFTKSEVPVIQDDHLQEMLLEAALVNGQQREQLVEEILSIDPNNTSAYLLLAEDADSEELYEEFLEQAIFVGERRLGKAFFLQNKGSFWILPETRPYMRAKEMYAYYLYHLGEYDEASKHFNELLRLNPSDNQGIRYTLLTLYIESGQFKEASHLMDQFKEDSTASFLFNGVIVNYLMHGLTDETKKMLEKAKQENPLIKDYLIGRKIIPHDIYVDIDIGIGNETEAIIYAQEHIHIWEAIPDLLIELKR